MLVAVKVMVVTVGRPGRLFAEPIAEYERRAARYWNLEVLEVREEKGTPGRDPALGMAAESARLVERVPAGFEIVALTRTGEPWGSDRLAEYLQELALRAHPGAAFLIGGAAGITPATLEAARHRLALSSFTLPHELARLVLAEQLYRAGTIVRGEPYHRGPR